MADASSSQPRRFARLSIFLVVALHTLQRFGERHPVGWFWYAIFNGSSGVFIFFEISGFLITTLLLHEHARRDSVSLRGFYLRRAFESCRPSTSTSAWSLCWDCWGA